MVTLGDLTTAQGLYTSNHIGSNGMDLGTTISTTSTIFAMGGNGTTNASINYIDRLELKMYKQSIRIIELENKMNKEECANLKAMLESNDEASVILAKEIIDNLEA